jgi:hypothetical protein
LGAADIAYALAVQVAELLKLRVQKAEEATARTARSSLPLTARGPTHLKLRHNRSTASLPSAKIKLFPDRWPGPPMQFHQTIFANRAFDTAQRKQELT